MKLSSGNLRACGLLLLIYVHFSASSLTINIKADILIIKTNVSHFASYKFNNHVRFFLHYTFPYKSDYNNLGSFEL